MSHRERACVCVCVCVCVHSEPLSMSPCNDRNKLAGAKLSAACPPGDPQRVIATIITCLLIRKPIIICLLIRRPIITRSLIRRPHQTSSDQHQTRHTLIQTL